MPIGDLAMKAELITHYGTDLSAVNAARVSMDKESDWEYGKVEEYVDVDSRTIYHYPNKKLNEKDAKLIGYLAKNKHFSCFEHQGATLRLKVPLFVRSQIHRHRTFSYNEISRRYVKDNLEFYWPDKWRKAAENVKQGSSDETVNTVEWTGEWHVPEQWGDEDAMRLCHANMVNWFNHMIDHHKICPEQARMILPQNLYTSFYMTGSLRNFCHFLKLRLDSHTQKECQDIAKMCADLIQPLFPVSYAALMETDA